MSFQRAQQYIRTLVIDDADGQDGEEPSPRSRGSNGVDDIVDLRRDIGADIFRVGEDRRQDGRRPGGIECVHGGRTEERRVLVSIRSSLCLCLFSRTRYALLQHLDSSSCSTTEPDSTWTGEERTDGGRRSDGDGDIRELRVDRGGGKQKGAGPGPSGVKQRSGTGELLRTFFCD